MSDKERHLKLRSGESCHYTIIDNE